MQKITPFLWVEDNAEEAVNFYVSIFKDAKVLKVTRSPEGTPGPAGQVLVISFELFGQHFLALNGGPHTSFTDAISFVVNCENQEEVDYYWSRLSEGGEEVQCGWLKDKFGLSWQITPVVLVQLLSDPDPEKAQRVMQAMLQMVKIDIPTLIRASETKQ